MNEMVYNVGDLRKLIAESSNEFKPVLGANVENDNKNNNEKTYKDAEKRAKDYDGGLVKSVKNSKLPEKTDFNATTLDYNPRTEPDKQWKEKVEAQSKGFTSKAEEDNKIEKSAEFDKEGKIFKQLKNANNERQKERNDLANSGLQAREMPKREKDVMTESTVVKPKRLIFKHTKFINESQVLARIPENYKVNGQKIYMLDAHNNEYIVECVQSDKTGVIETNIVSSRNQDMINEQMNRIQELFGYKTSTTNGKNSRQSQLNESKSFNEILNVVRK